MPAIPPRRCGGGRILKCPIKNPKNKAGKLMRIGVEKAEQEAYDLCIVGTGPAGIILALEYQKLQPKHRVLLIEYGTNGSVSSNHLDDSIKIVETKNHHLSYECTNKGLGGSSASWGGRCVMYDEIDFKPRKILEGQCTWDVSLFHESRRYASRAAEYFECGEAKFNLNEIPDFVGSHIAENFQSGDVTDSVVERYSIPTRFGERYRAEIDSSSAIHLLVGWEVFSLGATSQNGTITEAGIRDFSRTRKVKVSARKIVLAAGAQETTRLLLKNRQVFRNRGGSPAALGKYYQGHVSGKIASVRFYGDPKRTDYGFLRSADGAYLRRRFQLSTEALLENNLLNTAIWLDNPLYVDPEHRNGAMSFMYLAMITPFLGKKLAPPAIAQSITRGKVAGIPQHIKNILKDFPKSLTTPAAIFYFRYWVKRKLPGVFLYSLRNVYALHFHAEQVPVRENRMELAPDGETLNIHYKYTDQDVDSIIRTHEFLDKWLRRCKCGELHYWFPKDELPAAIRSMSMDGLHQVGTTRIAATADDGVVDDNLKVWGTANLYVCSSSVFPTSSQANPTFLLGVFAVRLAHHLISDS
jgi:choline dehydrogenase-like flavoprotein